MKLTFLLFVCVFLNISDFFPCHTVVAASRSPPVTRDANHVFDVGVGLLFSNRCWVWSKAALTSKASASKSSNRDSVASVWLSSSKLDIKSCFSFLQICFDSKVSKIQSVFIVICAGEKLVFSHKENFVGQNTNIAIKKKVWLRTNSATTNDYRK